MTYIAESLLQAAYRRGLIKCSVSLLYTYQHPHAWPPIYSCCFNPWKAQQAAIHTGGATAGTDGYTLSHTGVQVLPHIGCMSYPTTLRSNKIIWLNPPKQVARYISQNVQFTICGTKIKKTCKQYSYDPHSLKHFGQPEHRQTCVAFHFTQRQPNDNFWRSHRLNILCFFVN